jgi:hypothetical protein
MNNSIAPWKHASLSLSILVLLLSSLYFYLIEPALIKKKENIERFETLSFQLKKYGNTEQKIKDLNTQIKQLQEHNPNNLDFIKKKTSALVAADLQKLLKKLIESNGGNLVSTHAVTKPKDDVFSDITIKVHMRCNITTLRTVIYALASNKPLLFIDNLLIQKRASRSSRRRNITTDQLEIRFDVTGYINQSTS